MQVSYTINDEFKEKYLSINFDGKAMTKKRRLFLFMSLALIGASFVALYLKKYILFSFCLLISLPGIYITFLPKVIKRKYIESLNQNERSTIKLRDDTLTVSGGSHFAEVSYSQITDLKVYDDYFLVITFDGNNSLLIPRYAFSNDQQMDTFIETLKGKISQK